MINNVVLVGRLTQDPDTRYTSSGVAVCSFTVAVDRRFKNAKGERETDFIRVVAWRKTAELCGQYLSKGRMVGIEGSIQTRPYEDKDGNNRSAVEVVADNISFLEPKRTGSGEGGFSPRPAPPSAAPGIDDLPEPPADAGDDLPF